MLTPETIADAIVLTMRGALAPVQGRMQGAEIRLLEYAQAVDALCSRLESLERERADLRERLATLETRPPVPGPSGPPGRDGQDGAPGKDGMPGLRFAGVYVEGKTYDLGDLVTWGGSSWHCNETTTSKPGEGTKAWTLMVKRGRDGKDGRP